MIRISFFCLAVVLLSSTCFAYSGVVVNVFDGDSITLMNKGKKLRVTLYGIDAPELKQEHGPESRDFLASFVNKESVEATSIGKVGKGKMTGTVMLGDDNINELMILNGKAWVDRKGCREEFCNTWIKMEEAAKATRKGLWSSPAPEPPWEFQKHGPRKTIAPNKTHIKVAPR